MEQLNEQLREALLQLEARQRACEEQIASFNTGNAAPAQAEEEDEDIIPEIATGDQIQIESYRSIPEFSGNKGQYRGWSNQVTRRMKIIDNFKKHPKYEAALAIIRAKITGAASDVLTNNKTAYNIVAIIKRLDLSFADQRPFYILEAEMMSIKQQDKSLQEFYDAINQGLNLVISKIVMFYTQIDEQKALVMEAKKKATRTFIIGLKSSTMRNILYSHAPDTLEKAFTIAQTIHHDNQYMQLDAYKNLQGCEPPKYQPRKQQWQNPPIKGNNKMN